MKKILIIDDKKGSENVCDVVKYITSTNIELASKVIFDKKAETFFQWDEAGNNCTPLFKIDDFDYVFIHHSQKGDSLYPSTIIDLIKLSLRDKLVLFSGSIEEHFLDKSGEYTNRSIKRNKIITKITPFINKSLLIKRWELEFLYYDYEYEETLLRTITLMFDNEDQKKKIFDSLEMKALLKLLHVEHSSLKYDELYIYNGDELIDKLKNLLYE